MSGETIEHPLTFFLFAYWHDPFWKHFVGPSVKIWDLAASLHRQGHRVVLFLPSYGFHQLKMPFPIIEIPVIDFPFFRAFSYNLFLALYLLRGRARIHPDVVYLRRTTTVVPMIYAKLIRALFFYEVNDDPYSAGIGNGMSIESRLRGRLSAAIDELNFTFADRIFVISRAIMEKILRRNPFLSKDKLIFMPSGANTDIFYPMDRTMALTSVGLDKTKQYVGFVGTFLAHQGVDTLIDAAPFVLKHHPQCRFVLIGEGPMKARWREMINHARLKSVFIFTGQISYHQLPKWINAMDVCVAPYTSSAGHRSPVKIFDYLACGRPVVASRIEGTTDMFKDLSAVRLAAPHSPESLADAINRLLSDPDFCGTIGQTGSQWVKNNYARSAMAEQVSDAARNILREKR